MLLEHVGLCMFAVTCKNKTELQIRKSVCKSENCTKTTLNQHHKIYELCSGNYVWSYQIWWNIHAGAVFNNPRAPTLAICVPVNALVCFVKNNNNQFSATKNNYVICSTPRVWNWCKMISAAFCSCFRIRKPYKQQQLSKCLCWDMFFRGSCMFPKHA